MIPSLVNADLRFKKGGVFIVFYTGETEVQRR